MLTFPVDGSTDVHKSPLSGIYFKRKGAFKLENSIIKKLTVKHYDEWKNYSN